MPNWSYNCLTITGSKEKMEEFFNTALKPNVNGEISFQFSNIFPVPTKIKNTIAPSGSAKGRKWMEEGRGVIRNEKLNEILDINEQQELTPVENNTDEKCKALKEEFGADNWYDWNILHWGTKWDVEVLKSDLTVDDELFECFFDTAWSPPSGFLSKLQEKFQDLDIKLTYELEGSDDCGVFYTDRVDGIACIVNEEDEVSYQSEDGRSIYFDSNDSEWHFSDDSEICYEYVTINPFKE